MRRVDAHLAVFLFSMNNILLDVDMQRGLSPLGPLPPRPTNKNSGPRWQRPSRKINPLLFDIQETLCR